MKYLNKETSLYLVSLGCVSESGKWWVCKSILPEIWIIGVQGKKKQIAFSFEDILRKSNVEKIVKAKWPTVYPDEAEKDYYESAIGKIRDYPDTWPDEISKLILPSPKEATQKKAA